MVMTIFSNFSVITGSLPAFLYLPQFSLSKIFINYKRRINWKEPRHIFNEKENKNFSELMGTSLKVNIERTGLCL